MTTITDTSVFTDVPLLDVGAKVQGGPTGASNVPIIALSNRTRYLKDQLSNLANLPEAPQDSNLYGRANPVGGSPSWHAIPAGITDLITADGLQYIREWVVGAAGPIWKQVTIPSAGILEAPTTPGAVYVRSGEHASWVLYTPPAGVSDITTKDGLLYARFWDTVAGATVPVWKQITIPTIPVGEAPTTAGSLWLRSGEHGTWSLYTPPAAGITDVPTDTNLYARKGDHSWQPFIPGFTDTPVDSNTYLRTGAQGWGVYTAPTLSSLGGVPSTALGTSVATLVAGKVPASQLPSYVDEILELANLATFPAVGDTRTIYIDISTNYQYRWSGTTYVQLVSSPGTTDVIVEGVNNIYFTKPRVLATALTGLSTATNSVALSTDSVLVGLGKAQAQINALMTSITAKAASGVNSDITSLTGLTTPLSIAQGGTGNTTGAGAATTAVALATARSIAATGDATWTVVFDGSTNVTGAATLANTGVATGTYGTVTVNAKGLVVGAAVVTPVANGGTGVTTLSALATALAIDQVSNTSDANKPVSTAQGISIATRAAKGANSDITSLGGLTTPLSVAQGGTGTTTGAAAATTAAALTTARTITSTGDGSWTVTFDGSANVTSALTLAPSGVIAGTYGSVNVNSKGIVTGGSATTPVANGGTGATTGPAALAALGGVAASALGVSVATLVSGVVPASQLPSYVDEILERANLAAFPATGDTRTIYIDISTNYQYRWSGTTYVQLVSSPGTTDSVVEGTTNLYFTIPRTLAATLTGLVTTNNTAALSTDSVLIGIGKVQAQINTTLTSVNTKAAKGANSDITSLAGLTTPLSIAQGGTGTTTGAAAATTAAALATARNITATGDGSWTVTFDGSTNVTSALTLANTGVATGTYGVLTVNAKGLVVGAAVVTPVANGGTGVTTLPALATAMSLDQVNNTSDANKPVSTAQGISIATRAAKGANGDITSLTGLTTALTVAQGGTGVATLAALATAMSLDQVNNTSDVNKPVSTAQALAIAGKAASGANSDITSLAGLTTPLSIAQGGTGNTTGAGGSGSINGQLYFVAQF